MKIRKPYFDEEKDAQAINISPLIDVIFILLIFFIVTMVFSESDVVEVDLPQASNSISKSDNALQIYIEASGDIFCDEKLIPKFNLANFLKFKSKLSSKLVINADSSLITKHLVELMDIAKSAGFDEIYLATEKK